MSKYKKFYEQFDYEIDHENTDDPTNLGFLSDNYGNEAYDISPSKIVKTIDPEVYEKGFKKWYSQLTPKARKRIEEDPGTYQDLFTEAWDNKDYTSCTLDDDGECFKLIPLFKGIKRKRRWRRPKSAYHDAFDGTADGLDPIGTKFEGYPKINISGMIYQPSEVINEFLSESNEYYLKQWIDVQLEEPEDHEMVQDYHTSRPIDERPWDKPENKNINEGFFRKRFFRRKKR